MFWDGPYGPQDPRVFFDAEFYPYAFNPEVGSVGVPVEASVRVLLSVQELGFPEFVDWEDGDGQHFWRQVPSAAWQHHKYMSYGDPDHRIAGAVRVVGREVWVDGLVGGCGGVGGWVCQTSWRMTNAHTHIHAYTHTHIHTHTRDLQSAHKNAYLRTRTHSLTLCLTHEYILQRMGETIHTHTLQFSHTLTHRQIADQL